MAKKLPRRRDVISKEWFLKSAEVWELSYCEPTQGWPGQWTVIWRCEKYFGKISSTYKGKKAPTRKQIAELLDKELCERFQSSLRCDAKTVAYRYAVDKGGVKPSNAARSMELASALLYDLDNRAHQLIFAKETPQLALPSTMGWILGDIAELRVLVENARSYFKDREFY